MGAPPGMYPQLGEAGIPYPNSNEQNLYPMDNRPGFGATQPAQAYPANANQSFPQQPANFPNFQGGGYPAEQGNFPLHGRGFPPQPNFFPPQGRGFPSQPSDFPPQGRGFPPAPVPGFPQQTAVTAPHQMMGYQQHQGGFPYHPPTGYPQPQNRNVHMPQYRGGPQGGGYPQPQGYPHPGLYSSSSGNTDLAMSAGMGALAGLAGSYFADSTPTMGEMAIGAGVGGAVGLAGSAATSDGAMSALGLAGHDMGDVKARKRARMAARYGIPIAAMGAGYLTNKAFDRRSGYHSN